MIYGDLSSSMTGFYKYVFLPIWSAGFGWGSLQLFMHPDSVTFNGVRGGAPAWAPWVFLGAWLLGTAFLALLTYRLRWLRAYDNSLYASGFGREIEIPAKCITAVEQIGGSRPALFRIRFVAMDGDKRTIWFMPAFNWPSGAIEPNLLADLRSFAAGVRTPAA